MKSNKELFLEFLKEEGNSAIVLDKTSSYATSFFAKTDYYANNRFKLILSDYTRMELLRAKLEVVGIYDTKDEILYVSNSYAVSDLCENIKTVSIYDLSAEILDEINRAYNEMINNKADYLKKKAMKKFNKFYSYKENVTTLQANTESIIKHNNKITMPTFKCISNGQDETRDYVICDYVTDKETYIKNYIENYINNEKCKKIHSEYSGIPSIDCTVEEYEGFRLLKFEKQQEMYQEMLESNKDLVFIKDIVNSISDDNIKTVNVTVTKDNETLTFKYDAPSLRRLFFDAWYIKEVALRDTFKRMMSNTSYRSEDRMKYITKITYGKKVLFETK